jgi:hypothetical protein
VYEGVPKKVEAHAQEKHRQEDDQTSEGSRQPSANNQGLGDVLRADADESFCTHGLPLVGTLPNGDEIREAQKLKISEMWRSVGLLHGSAADTAWITSLDCVFELNQDFAMTRWIRAMPLFP